ncbi:hypothetical protein [Aeromicrobium massiliense]|uniref:hypothetical protein n=1 Tax=Aeromicrobium massiliense TaxID=1464554 RepID=UPI00030CEC2B|nr:hypothetical protein [Aeromicrobium massiliense]
MPADPHRRVQNVFAWQRDLLGCFLADVEEAAAAPRDGTCAAADVRWMGEQFTADTRAHLRNHAVGAVRGHLSVAAEHFEVLDDLARRPADDVPVRVCLTLARTVLEGAMRACWLVDTGLDSKARVTRWAAALLQDAEDVEQATVDIAPGERLEIHDLAQELRLAGQGLVTSAGFAAKAKGGDRAHQTAQVEYEGVRSDMAPKMVDLTGQFLRAAPGFYKVTSAAAHTLSWAAPMDWGDDDGLVHNMAVPLLDVSDALVLELATYLGLPGRPLLLRTNNHRMGLTRATITDPHPKDRYADLDTYRERTRQKPVGGRPPGLTT